MKITSSSSGTNKIVQLNINSKQISFELPKRTNADFQTIFFNIVDHARMLQKKLDEQEDHPKYHNLGMFSGISQVEKKKKGDKVRRKPGMSMLNPASKKTKVPSGVVFD